MRNVLVILLCLLLPMTLAEAAPKTEQADYYAGAVTPLSCPEEAPLVPQGDPLDHPSPLGWLFSGEPECAYANLHNAVGAANGEEAHRVGLGGVAFPLEHVDKSTPASLFPHDALLGPAGYVALYIGVDEGDEVRVEGCGAQHAQIPAHPETHWQNPGFHLLPWWALFTEPLFVEDDLDVCYASTGTVQAVWGA